MTTPIITLRGEKVGLGPIYEDALPLIQRWWNDPVIMLTLSGVVWPQTTKNVRDWYEKDVGSNGASSVNFLVYEIDTERPIGCVALAQINYRSQTAWPAYYIGERDCWGKGYGTEATQLLINYAFDVLGLHSLTVAIHADNPASLRVAEKVGYRVIGRQRQSAFKGGQRVDAILLDITADDWRAAQ